MKDAMPEVKPTKEAWYKKKYYLTSHTPYIGRLIGGIERRLFSIAFYLWCVALGIGLGLHNVGYKGWESFPSTIFATASGVLGSALFGYALWRAQQRHLKNDERQRATTNLINELNENSRRLSDLTTFLDALTPEKLGVVLPYMLVSHTIDRVVSENTITLFSDELQNILRQIAQKTRDFNHMIDYCEKSNTNMIFLIAMYRPSGSANIDKAVDGVFAFQTRHCKDILAEPVRELPNLIKKGLTLLQEQDR